MEKQATHALSLTGIIMASGSILFLALALLTYNISDPGWSRVGFDMYVSNQGGLFGAWLADFLYFFLGYIALLIPLFATLMIVLRRSLQQFNTPLLVLKGLGLCLCLLSSAALFSLFLSINHHLPSGPGGLLGQMLAWHLMQVMNVTGSCLCLLLVWFISLLWLQHGFQWSWKPNHLFTMPHWDGLNKLHAFFQSKRPANQQKPVMDTLMGQHIPDLKQSDQTVQENTHKMDCMITDNTLSFQQQSMPISSVIKRPTTDLLRVNNAPLPRSQKQQEDIAQHLEQTLKSFGVQAKVVSSHTGPVITRYEVQPAEGTRSKQIANLSEDLARSLSVTRVRVVEVIPGKTVIGIELPNKTRRMVRLREVLDAPQYQRQKSPLLLALGQDIAGQPVYADLAKMPHLLVAGTTGSGKSVGINAMVLSLLYNTTPDQLRLILIDPKMLELSVYDGIGHLLTPVVTDMKEAASSLRWCVQEMERRYQLMASLGVRNLQGYNDKINTALQKGQPIRDPLRKEEEKNLEPLPYIVVVADEFADMMMVVGKEVEQLIARIAQKARAAGIHLILATQRPSVDVITGLIKANVPTRIAFQVSSRIDSRTVIDQAGAEQLLGHGDMLYLPPGTGLPVRVHGAFVEDDEVHKVVSHLKRQGKPQYDNHILQPVIANTSVGGSPSNKDALYDEAVSIVKETRRASISSVQRRLRIGYNRAANLIEAMEEAGLVGPMESNGARKILMDDIES